jgi:hypothetical protein
LLLVAACGGSHSGVDIGTYALEITPGRYFNGSGTQSLALLATARDKTGTGPAEPWPAEVLQAATAVADTFNYDDSSVGSVQDWWWPGVTASDGESFSLQLTGPDGGNTVQTFTVPSASPLALALPSLSADATTLNWNAVSGAVSYECLVYTQGSLQLDAKSTSPGCDVSALPAGSYTAQVLAMTADLAALTKDSTQTPKLPSRFDVSEADLGFVLGAGDAGVQVTAVGGAIDYGGASPGLALWFGLSALGGAASPISWNISVTGPGIPAAMPLTLSYPANTKAYLTWDYNLSSTPGNYTATFTSSAGEAFASFAVGTPPSLAAASGITATLQSNGDVVVNFSPVTGARSYEVSAWGGSPSVPVDAQWVAGGPVTFPKASFSSGTQYSVYVDATNADLVGETQPSSLTVSENTYAPVTFTAP